MTTIALKPTSTPRAASERTTILEDSGFGRYFTDHMVTIQWEEGAAGTTPSSCRTRRSRSTRR